jgi:transposase
MNANMPAQLLLPLKDVPAEERTFLNSSVWFIDADGYRVVFCRHEPLYRVALDDGVHLRLVAVSLRQSQLATQEEIARAFGHRVITQARWERQYEKQGIEGLTPKRPTGRSRRLDKTQERFVRKWFGAGWSNCRMAKRLGVGEATIRRTLKRLGMTRSPATLSPCLPGLEQEPAGAVAADAFVAVAGEEAAEELPTPPVSPARGSDAKRADSSAEDAAEPSSFSADEQRVAFLYVDGHVREYHGKFPLFEAKKAQRQVVTPAATDTWVHDAEGEPLLVVTSAVNAKLTQVLEPILADVRRLVGDQRRLTVIFDRGGFSPKLFARLIAAGFDVITYRKGKVRKLAAAQFTVEKQKIEGAWRQYEVCDRPRVRVGALPAAGQGKRKRAKTRTRYLWMREVRVLRDGGRQTPILTNRQDLSAVTVAYRIFQRWRQENYFKYAEEEFALAALVEYGAAEVPAATDRRNPQWLRLTRRLKEARAEVARFQSELGKEAAANQEATRPTRRGFKIAHAGLREQLQQGEAQIERLLAQRKQTPKRIPASDLKMLKSAKRLIADTIKMAAYHVETELLEMLQDQQFPAMLKAARIGGDGGRGFRKQQVFVLGAEDAKIAGSQQG